MTIEQKCWCILLKRIIGNWDSPGNLRTLSLWPRRLCFFLLYSSWLSSWGSPLPVVSWLVPREGLRPVMCLRPYSGSLSQLLWPLLVLQAPSPQLELQDWFLVQNMMSQLPVLILSWCPGQQTEHPHLVRKGLSEMMRWGRPSPRSARAW